MALTSPEEDFAFPLVLVRGHGDVECDDLQSRHFVDQKRRLDATNNRSALLQGVHSVVARPVPKLPDAFPRVHLARARRTRCVTQPQPVAPATRANVPEALNELGSKSKELSHVAEAYART